MKEMHLTKCSVQLPNLQKKLPWLSRLPKEIYLFALLQKCPNTKFFWLVYSHIWIEYGDLFHKSAYSVRIRENKDFEAFKK